MPDMRNSTIDLIQNTQAVLGAVDMFRTAVAGGDPSDIDFASEMLFNATNGYSGSSDQYQKMGFDELSTAAVEDASRAQMNEDLLASALLDVEVGNVLIAAGRVGQETAEPLPLEHLDDSRSSLDDLVKHIALPMGKTAGEPVMGARFGFDETPAAAAAAPSPDVASARAAYSQHLDETLSTLKTHTLKVLSSSYKALEKLDQDQITSALSVVGETATDLPQLGKLINRGLELTLVAMDKISKLLGKDNSQLLKDKADEILKQVKEGGSLMDKFLNHAYGYEATRQKVGKQLQDSKAAADRLDAGIAKLTQLSTSFAERMELTIRIGKALNTGKSIVGLLLPKAASELIFAAFYLILMDYAVLTGMDYADTSTLYHFVNGVVKVSDETLLS